MGLIDVGNDNIGQPLRVFPPPDSPLILERFFDTLYLRYDERFVYSAPDLSSKTRRSEWSSDSPALDSPLASSLDYEIRLAENPGGSQIHPVVIRDPRLLWVDGCTEVAAHSDKHGGVIG